MFRNTFLSFSSKNFQLWFVGQIISFVGNWIQITAQGFLVYELTHSSAYLGITSFVSGIPSLLLMPWGGVIADRVPRKQLLIVTQICFATSALILTTLTFSGIIHPWHIIAFSFFNGVILAFEVPTRHAFISDISNKEHLTNAIALNSLLMNFAVFVGPAIAGVIHAKWGAGWCFFLNTVSFLASLITLAKIPNGNPPMSNKNSRGMELVEGFRYIWNAPVIRNLILLCAGYSVFGFGFISLTPALAVDVLNGAAGTNGALVSARGLGAFIAALLVAALSTSRHRKPLMLFCGATFPVFIGLIFFLKSLPIALVIFFILGFFFIVTFNLINSMIQINVDPLFRGRVMAIYAMLFFAGVPFSSLIMGYIAHFLNISIAFLFSGISTFILVMVPITKLSASTASFEIQKPKDSNGDLETE